MDIAELKTNKLFWDFVYSHINDNCLSLRLKYAKLNDFDVRFAIDQIEARQKVKDKLPFVAVTETFLFPSLISAEQCTSEAVANFKSSIFNEGYN
ncbi:MAG: SAM-dependent methyltransferase, partial [Bacteroidales bacterium]|nr:SAM-dependent methyltransferase [Bacteroidales bacterium]